MIKPSKDMGSWISRQVKKSFCTKAPANVQMAFQNLPITPWVRPEVIHIHTWDRLGQDGGNIQIEKEHRKQEKIYFNIF